MAENSNPQPNNDQPKMPKFNVTWIYTIIIIALAILFFTGGGNALGGDSSASQTATYTQFKKYVAKGYAKSVVVIKPDNKLKMFVKPEHIRDVFQRQRNRLDRNLMSASTMALSMSSDSILTSCSSKARLLT